MVGMAGRLMILACLAACSGSSAHALDSGVNDSATAPDVPDAIPPTPPDPGHSSLVTDRDTAIAGVDSVNIMVSLRDAAAQPIAGAHVDLAASGAGNQFSLPAPTDGNGLTIATWTSTRAGSHDLTVSVGGVVIGTHTVAFLPGPLAQLAFVTEPTTAIMGAPLASAVAAEDSNGNVVSGATGTIRLSLSPNAANALLQGGVLAQLVGGVATFTAAHVDVAGAGYTLSAALAGLPAATSAPFDVNPGSPDQAHSSISAAPASLDADGVSSTLLTVHVGNQYGIGIANVGVSLAVSGTNNTLVPASGVTTAAGAMTADLSSTTAELKTVTATVAGTITLTQPVHFYPVSCKPQLPAAPSTQLDHAASHMVTGDVDGDGHIDAIVAEPNQGIAIYRGRGDGTFFPPTSLPLATTVQAMAVGDFNNDGHLDLVIVFQGSSSFGLSLGAGNGMFATPTAIALPSQPYRVAIGDFDRDGKLDLAVGLPSSNEILIEVGGGNGTFVAGPMITSVTVGDVAAADVNSDGKLDVMTDDGSELYVALGNGSGGFAAPVRSLTEGNGKMFVGDFNHDGKPDVLVSGYSQIASMRGNGTASFTQVGNAIPTADYPVDGGGVNLPDGGAVVDLDGDGNLDLLVEAGGMLSVLKGAGDGTFTLAQAYSGGADMSYFDANGDGIRDIVAISVDALGVMPGLAGGRFSAPSVHVAPGVLFATTSDLDGNGQLDLVRDRASSGFIGELSHLDGSITDGPMVASTSQPYDVALMDVTGDGKADLLALNGALMGVTIDTAVGNGDGSFQSFTSQAIASPYVTAMFPANLNGDARRDLVFTYPSQGTVWFALGHPNGTFAALQSVSASSSHWLVVQDVSGDGISDVLSSTAVGDLAVLVGTGTGGFGNASTYPTSGLLDTAVVGDVDADGKPDVVMLHRDPISKVFSISVMRGLGAGAFGPPIVTPGVALPNDSTYITDFRLADFTGDGTLDVVASTNSGVVIVPGYGDAYFRQHTFFYGFVGHGPLAISDHNGDGLPDIAFGTATGIAIALYTSCVP